MANVNYTVVNGKMHITPETFQEIVREVKADLKVTAADPTIQAQVLALVEKIFDRLELRLGDNVADAWKHKAQNS